MERRSTTLFDINGIEIFEGDWIEQERRDRPHSKYAKSVWVKGKVVWVPANTSETMSGYSVNRPPHWDVDFSQDVNSKKYGCHCWSPFFMCRVKESQQQ